MDFNKLNSELYQLSMPSRFPKKISDYNKGYIKISDWVSELCFYYEKKREEQELMYEDEFIHLIEVHMQHIDSLDESEYKRGLMKALEEVGKANSK